MAVTVLAFFVNGGSPATGLAPTVTIRDASDGSVVVNGEAMTEVGDGYYRYEFTAYDPAKIYAVLCDGGASLVHSDRYAIPVMDSNGPLTNILEDTSDIQPRVQSIEADTNALQQDWADGGRLDSILDATKQNTNDILEDTADMQPRVAAVEADTNELQQDWADGGRLDVVLDSVKANTEQSLVNESAIKNDTGAILEDTADMQPRVQSIEADTNELQQDWADGGRLNSILDGVSEDTDAILNYLAQEGSSTVVITVLNRDFEPVPDCRVEVWNETQVTFLTWGMTDSNGQVTFALDDGEYKVLLRKAGYVFSIPESLTVAGATNQTYYGDTVTIDAPEIVGACRVYEYCYDPSGMTPLPSITASAQIVSLPFDRDDKLHAGTEVEGAYNPSTGLVYWDIIKGAKVRFAIDELGVRSIKIIPSSDTARLTSLTSYSS